jgi:hypothetical protein
MASTEPAPTAPTDEIVVYQEFNGCVEEILQALATRFPSNNDGIRKAFMRFRAFTKEDVAGPMGIWCELTKDIENLEELLENPGETTKAMLKSVVLCNAEVFSDLNPQKYLPRLSDDNVKNLVHYLKRLKYSADITDSVGVDLISSMQNMLFDLEKKGKVDMNIDPTKLDLAEMASFFQSVVGDYQNVQQELAKFQQKLTGGDAAETRSKFDKLYEERKRMAQDLVL